MQDIFTDTLTIVFACLVITTGAGALVLFRPSARRRRRRKKHSRRPKIDLFEPAQAESPTSPDA